MLPLPDSRRGSYCGRSFFNFFPLRKLPPFFFSVVPRPWRLIVRVNEFGSSALTPPTLEDRACSSPPLAFPCTLHFRNRILHPPPPPTQPPQPPPPLFFQDPLPSSPTETRNLTTCSLIPSLNGREWSFPPLLSSGASKI